jgi:hypothetical protein
MRDLWDHINLVTYVTTWSNRNCYSKVVYRRENEVAQDDGQGRAIIVEPRFHPGYKGANSTSLGLCDGLPYVRSQRLCARRVVRFFSCKVYIDSNLRDTLRYG